MAVLLEEIARTSADVASTSARSKKTERLAATLARLGPNEVRVGVAYLSGDDELLAALARIRDVSGPMFRDYKSAKTFGLKPLLADPHLYLPHV